MTTSYESRLGTSPEEAIKAPCVASTPANITLSGEQTIDGVAVVSGDRVLVRSQTDTTENGIYDCSTSAWTRSTDWNDATDVINGMLVPDANATNDVIYKAEFTGDYSPGITLLTFAEAVSSGLNTYTGSAGIQSEYDARGQYDVKYMDDLIGVDLTSFVVGEEVLCAAINVGSPGTYSTWQKVSDSATAPDVATGVNTDGFWYSATTGATKFKRVRQTQIDNVAALKLYEGEYNGQQITMRGYYADIEGGGQPLQWDAASTETANDGTIFQVTGVPTGRWKSIDTSIINVKQFGATGDGVTDDTALVSFAFNALIDGMTLIFNPGSYVVTAGTISTTAIKDNTIDFNGATILIAETQNIAFVFSFASPENLTIKNGIFDVQDKFVYRVFYVTNPVGVTFEHNTFKDVKYPSPEYVVNDLSSGITVAAGSNIKFYNNTFIDWYYHNYDGSIVNLAGAGGEHLGRGIDLQKAATIPCENIHADGNSFTTARISINGDVPTNIRVTNNKFEDTTDNCIYMNGINMAISGNTLLDGEEGMVLSGDGIIIDGNFLENQGNKGIAFHGFINNAVISNNFFKADGANTLQAIITRNTVTADSGELLITGNTFDGDIDFALIDTRGIKRLLVTNNIFNVTSSTSGRVYKVSSAGTGTDYSAFKNNIVNANYTSANIIVDTVSTISEVDNNHGIDPHTELTVTNLLNWSKDAGSVSGMSFYEAAGSNGGVLDFINKDPTIFTGQSLGAVAFSSLDATGGTSTIFGKVEAQSEGTFSPGSNPTGLYFYVTKVSTETPQVRAILDSEGRFLSVGGIGAGNSATNTNTPAGATARDLEIFDETGASIGFIPVYAARW